MGRVEGWMTTEDQGNRVKIMINLLFIKKMKFEQTEARSAHLLPGWLSAQSGKEYGQLYQ